MYVYLTHTCISLETGVKSGKIRVWGGGGIIRASLFTPEGEQ